MTNARPTTIMALDVGVRRIGVALASSQARLPQPFKTLDNTPGIFKQLTDISQVNKVEAVVIGWPRGLAGQTTSQTKLIEAFASQLKRNLKLPVHLQDEAVTSHQAEAELKARNKPYDKADIDSLAATYILEDYLRSKEVNRV